MVNTQYWIVDKARITDRNYPHLIEAAQVLQQGELVAFPTETVYGLGADATNDVAVAKIYEAKGRPSDNPLIVHISSQAQLEPLVQEIPELATKLMEHFWPGPLTLVLKAKPGALSEKVTAGLETVAVRMPDHPVALALISSANLPIAAPSANTSGKPSPTKGEHVRVDLDGKIAAILDGGATGVGVESTVVDCTELVPVILRPGGVTKEELERIVGKVEVDRALVSEEVKPKSPGMKYAHYAPSAPMYLVYGDSSFIQHLIEEERKIGKRVGVLTTTEQEKCYQAEAIVSVGQRGELETVARGLYDALRSFDESHVDVIFSEVFAEVGVGVAVMNRLKKAAGGQVIVEEK